METQSPSPAGVYMGSTLLQQQQHLAYIRSDANALQQKVLDEISHFEEHTDLLKQFLLKFVDEFQSEQQLLHGEHKYKNILQEIVDQTRDDLPIHLSDVKQFFASQGDGSEGAKDKRALNVYEGLLVNTPRYMELLYTAADSLLAQPDLFVPSGVDNERDVEVERLLAVDGAIGVDAAAAKRSDPWRKIRARDMAARGVPACLRSTYRIILIPPSSEGSRLFRSVDASCMGKFSFFTAEVVRVQTTKPQLLVAAYECETCHDKVFQPVEDSAFMPLVPCPQCKAASKNSALHFHSKLSLFLPFQEMRVQEPTSQVPEANVPRALTCHLLGHAFTNKLQPGMQVTLGGILKPVKKYGFAGLRAGLIQEKTFDVYHISMAKQSTTHDRREEAEVRRQLSILKQMPGLYDLLARSVAPGVFGMEDVKKALLLQLIGGQTKVKNDGGMIRGDIHVLLMGDPGVAKSQLMKQVCQVASRAIYTTGKGSSSSGLTAAVIKDPVTMETTLEGGALVLADRGICCIDEFDKMDEYDRSAIYEVMEQQSVSIAKAGHCSCLPARTAVLAAANPQSGRYDLKKSMMANMNLPAALLSRFDLQFLLLDRSDPNQDAQMAAHILGFYRNTNAHEVTAPLQAPPTNRRGRHKKQQATPQFVDKKVLRAFIDEAKHIEPQLQQSLLPQIAEWYATTRFDEQQEERLSGSLPSYTTPRALLGILRLAQALARLRGSNMIEGADFEEALRLLEASKASVRLAEEKAKKRRHDKVTQVFELLKNTRSRLFEQKGSRWDGYVKISLLERQAAALNISPQQLMLALEQYETLLILTFNRTKTKVAFVEEARSEAEEDDDADMIDL